MKKIVIGVHGLGNKPSRRLLCAWWKRSMVDGLKTQGGKKPFVPFEMVYWADILHPIPQDPRQQDRNHPLFLDEKYVKPEAVRPEPEPLFREKLIGYIDRNLDKIFLNEDFTLNFTFLSDSIIRRYFSEFETYYSRQVPWKNKGNRPAKVLIRERLFAILKRHRNKRILLVAHSMGSVIAFDVLFSRASEIEVDTFVTLGSPLGLPMVVHRIFSEHYSEKAAFKPGILSCPDSVRKHWFNFSDIEDKVALDHTLMDDFKANRFGVRPVDAYVRNSYAMEGVRNPHKDFGYLRTPEMARVLSSFLLNP